jgi:hypothetical protein
MFLRTCLVVFLLLTASVEAATCDIFDLDTMKSCTATGCPHYVGQPGGCTCKIDHTAIQLAQDTDGTRFLLVTFSTGGSVWTVTPNQDEIQPGWEVSLYMVANSAGHCKDPSIDGFQDIIFVDYISVEGYRYMNVSSTGNSLINPTPSFSCVLPDVSPTTVRVCDFGGGQVILDGRGSCFPSVEVNIFNNHTSQGCLVPRPNANNNWYKMSACTHGFWSKNVRVECR